MDGLIGFCAMCFADEAGGSWGNVVIRDVNHCANCGSGGTIVQIPLWAVDSIRQQASWVGKRYYPNDEDEVAYKERDSLMKLVEKFPGRSATALEDESGRWEVTQLNPKGSFSMTWVTAESADAAMRKAKSLTYFSEDQFHKS